MMLFPNAGMKAIALFGSIRSAGIMLATIVSYEVMKFGGHALASFAGNFQGQVQAAGSQAAQATATAEGISSSLGQHKSAGATMMMASNMTGVRKCTAKPTKCPNHTARPQSMGSVVMAWITLFLRVLVALPKC